MITRYAVENFTGGDWLALGQLTGYLSVVQDHPRLLRSLSFGDEDYAACAAEVLGRIFEQSEAAIDDVVDQYDIDLWYEQKYPGKYQRVFLHRPIGAPAFWKPECLRAFVSHLSRNRKRVAQVKDALAGWGISAFIAHQDIEPSREWQAEIETALATMDVMVAVLEPGFRESAWTDQEVGYALGRGVDVIPLLVGVEPHGFIAKIQGIHIKSKLPSAVAEDLAMVLLRRARHRATMLTAMTRALAAASSEIKTARVRRLDGSITDEQLKSLLEGIGLAEDDKEKLKDIAHRVGAFEHQAFPEADDDDIPF